MKMESIRVLFCSCYLITCPLALSHQYNSYHTSNNRHPAQRFSHQWQRLRQLNSKQKIKTRHSYPWGKGLSILLLVTKWTWHLFATSIIPTKWMEIHLCALVALIKGTLKFQQHICVLPCTWVYPELKPVAVNIVSQSFDAGWKCSVLSLQIALQHTQFVMNHFIF